MPEVRLLVHRTTKRRLGDGKNITIKGKTTSQYLASVVVDNLLLLFILRAQDDAGQHHRPAAEIKRSGRHTPKSSM
ncbi:hypothetical protein ACLB1N_32995 [Escherichia coli]